MIETLNYYIMNQFQLGLKILEERGKRFLELNTRYGNNHYMVINFISLVISLNKTN